MAIKIVKVMFLITIVMVMVIALFSSINIQHLNKSSTTSKEHEIDDNLMALSRPRRISRFLAETGYQNGRSNPMTADHCNKDNEICKQQSIAYGKNTTCCNNKCMDLMEDKHNCGACKNKCKFTQQCCGGECVDLSYDKRNCGSCNNKCLEGQFCLYGMCDYA